MMYLKQLFKKYEIYIAVRIKTDIQLILILNWNTETFINSIQKDFFNLNSFIFQTE